MTSFSYENRKGSGKKLKVHFDLPADEDYPIDHIKMKHSSSSISSQSSLDSDDSDKDREIFEESNNGGYGSPVWSFQGGSVTHSPPIQLMSHNPNSGYDPNRIPSSAFGPKPASPMEWSVASNESLFSLHFGNNSFSREQFLAFRKSGELSRTNDLNNTPPPTLKLVQEVNHSNDDNKVDNERLSLSSNSSHDSTDTPDITINISSNVDDKRTSNVEEITLDKTPDNQSKEAEVPNEEPKNYATNVSYLSVESDISNRSFQFPILTHEGARTSSETIESEKKEKNEKQQQQQPIENTNSLKSETKPKQRVRGWRCCSCFSCSPCY